MTLDHAAPRSPQADMLAAVEDTMQRAVGRVNTPGYAALHHWLAYHLGWEGEGAGPEARGKRLRPLMTLLVAQATGGNWPDALPAAAAVELIHNFSLIHDDIEDNSALRRGRPTLWSRWGVAQAVNTGDTLFTLAHQSIFDLRGSLPPAAVLHAAQVLQDTCLHLTQGQYLDISYETRVDLSESDYWPMVEGKTAALVAACMRLGAIAAHAAPEVEQGYARFGRLLGLAFQVQDDLLGIWGDPATTGKSAASDLVSGKKSLPVLLGLAQDGAFARRWLQGPIRDEEAPGVAGLLEECGARQAAQARARSLTDEALQALDDLHPQGEAGQLLRNLTGQLLNRQV